MEYPRLVESSVRNYLYDTLHRCHQYKSNIYSWVFNIALFLMFCLIIGTILYLRRKQRNISPQEREEKMLREQNYVLSKIRQYQMDQKRQSTMITDLPFTYNPDVGLDP
jgi:hypothetical protein